MKSWEIETQAALPVKVLGCGFQFLCLFISKIIFHFNFKLFSLEHPVNYVCNYLNQAAIFIWGIDVLLISELLFELHGQPDKSFFPHY